jgi:hypothetical protein
MKPIKEYEHTATVQEMLNVKDGIPIKQLIQIVTDYLQPFHFEWSRRRIFDQTNNVMPTHILSYNSEKEEFIFWDDHKYQILMYVYFSRFFLVVEL